MVSKNGKIRESWEGEGIEKEGRQMRRCINILHLVHGKAFGKQLRSLSLEIWYLDAVYLLYATCYLQVCAILLF